MLASARPALALPTWRSRLLGEFWIYLGLCAFFAVIAIQYAGKIRGGDRPDSQSAFLRWTPTVRQLPEVNIWKQQNWPASPIMAMILQPFMEINPPFLGSQVWMLAKMAMTLASIWLVFRMLDRPETPFPLWGKALAVLLTLRPIEGDLVHGNVNLFSLLCVVGCMYSYRRGWDTVAGLSLALGIACKVTPALFLPYFLWKRSWKILAAATVGMGLYLVVIPSLYFGWTQNNENLASWYDGMIRPFVEKYEVTSEHPNQSLPGLLERTLRHRPSSTIWDDTENVFQPTEYHNFVDLPQEVVSKISKGPCSSSRSRRFSGCGARRSSEPMCAEASGASRSTCSGAAIDPIREATGAGARSSRSSRSACSCSASGRGNIMPSRSWFRSRSCATTSPASA